MPYPIDPTNEASWEDFMRTVYDRYRIERDSLATPWRDLLTDGQRQLLFEANFYIKHIWDGETPLSDGKRLELITALSDLLDKFQKHQVAYTHW
jgi:hypothetical protein